MFINQIRMKIGVMFGNPETTTGGNALKFYSSVRLDIRRIGAIKESATIDKKEPGVIGNRTRVKVVKNKMAPPFREVEFDILYGQGISRAGDVLDLASEASVVEKSGAWFSFQGDRIGQGRDNARTYLEQHPDMLDKVEALLLAKQGIKRTTSLSDERAPSKNGTPSDERASSKNGNGEERAPTKASASGEERAAQATASKPNANAPSATRPATKGSIN
jgi:recombination protein RecA